MYGTHKQNLSQVDRKSDEELFDEARALLDFDKVLRGFQGHMDNQWFDFNKEVSAAEAEILKQSMSRAEKRRLSREIEETSHHVEMRQKYMRDIEAASAEVKNAIDRLNHIPGKESGTATHIDAKMYLQHAIDIYLSRVLTYLSEVNNSLCNVLLHELDGIIDRMLLPENRERFFQNPGKDFTRNRSCTLKDVVYLLVGMGRKSLGKELFYFYRSDDVITPSGFVQQKAKLKPEGVEFVFEEFSKLVNTLQRGAVKGLRVIAADGTDINVATNPGQDTYVEGSSTENGSGYNQYHVVTIQDVITRNYIDVEIQPRPECNETGAAAAMLRRLNIPGNAVFMADRGFASFNLIETCNRCGISYCLRIREDFCREARIMPLEEGDQDFVTTIFTSQTVKHKELISQGLGRYLSGVSRFGKYKVSQSWYYEDECTMYFRIVRFSLGVKDGNEIWETIITSLPREEFSIQDLKELYHLRWSPVEGGYRNLKYDLGLNYFHCKKDAFYRQEIYGKLTAFNFGQTIMNYADTGCGAFEMEYILPNQIKTESGTEPNNSNNPKGDDHESSDTEPTTIDHYQLNRSMCFTIAMDFFVHEGNVPYNVTALMRRYVLPVRYNRQYPRKIRPIPFPGYWYK